LFSFPLSALPACSSRALVSLIFLSLGRGVAVSKLLMRSLHVLLGEEGRGQIIVRCWNERTSMGKTKLTLRQTEDTAFVAETVFQRKINAWIRIFLSSTAKQTRLEKQQKTVESLCSV
jgi:hypothetical protein